MFQAVSSWKNVTHQENSNHLSRFYIEKIDFSSRMCMCVFLICDVVSSCFAFYYYYYYYCGILLLLLLIYCNFFDMGFDICHQQRLQLQFCRETNAIRFLSIFFSPFSNLYRKHFTLCVTAILHIDIDAHTHRLYHTHNTFYVTIKAKAMVFEFGPHATFDILPRVCSLCCPRVWFCTWLFWLFVCRLALNFSNAQLFRYRTHSLEDWAVLYCFFSSQQQSNIFLK